MLLNTRRVERFLIRVFVDRIRRKINRRMRSSRYFASVCDVDGDRMEGPFLIHPYECLLMGTGWTVQAPLREMCLVHLSSVFNCRIEFVQVATEDNESDVGLHCGSSALRPFFSVGPVLDTEQNG